MFFFCFCIEKDIHTNRIHKLITTWIRKIILIIYYLTYANKITCRCFVTTVLFLTNSVHNYIAFVCLLLRSVQYHWITKRVIYITQFIKLDQISPVWCRLIHIAGSLYFTIEYDVLQIQFHLELETIYVHLLLIVNIPLHLFHYF